MYQLWFKRTNCADAQWQPMSYAARQLDRCEMLLDHYQSEWGNFYTYTILPEGMRPTIVAY